MAGDADDLLLVHADEGTQHRHGGHVIADAQRLNGLAGHLTEALAGDQRLAAQLMGQPVGKAHHEAAHDEGEVILRTLAADLLLDLGKGHDVDGETAAPDRQLLSQLQNLFPGLLAGIGRRGKVQQLQLYAPLGDHIAGHGAVDAAGQQADRVAAHADGQAAGGGFRRAVDIGRVLPYLQIDRQLRIVDVHGQMGKGVVERAAHPLAQLDGAHGEGFVGTLALHLEGFCRQQRRAQILLRGGEDGLLLLGTGHGPGDGDDAEHLLAGVVSRRQIAGLLRRLHIDGGLAGVNLELAVPLGATADVAHQLHLKAVAVQALEHHLAQLAKNDLMHGDVLLMIYGFISADCCCGIEWLPPDAGPGCAPRRPDRQWCGPCAGYGHGCGR